MYIILVYVYHNSPGISQIQRVTLRLCDPCKKESRPLMSIEREIVTQSHTDELPKRCPVDHKTYSQQKTSLAVEPAGASLSCDDAGIWHVQRFDEARAILRSPHTKQAGFNAEMMAKLPQTIRPSILYQEGKPHHQQRKQTARFFAPKVVSAKYHVLMENVADRLIAKLQRQK